MSFNLVLDEPVEGDKVETHEGLQFTVESKIYDEYGPFKLTSIERGSQVYLQLSGSKQPADSGGCSTCSSCG